MSSTVEAFVGLLRDVEVERGLMVSASGYTKAALQRAFADDVDLDLDILSLAELTHWQNHGGLPYAGRSGAIIEAPMGWVLDPHPHHGILAALYRRGLSLEKAAEQREFMYLSLWERTEMPSVDDLVAKQNSDLRQWSSKTEISVSGHGLRDDFATRIRRAFTPSECSAEVTGFVEFERFVLFVVLHTPLVVERRNVRKLEYVLQTAIQVDVIQVAP